MLLSVMFQTGILAFEGLFAATYYTWKPDLLMDQAYMATKITPSVSAGEID